jgi:NADH dehydrogenase FAD-containing subunit
MERAAALILGGGVGGVVAANALRSRLGRRHRIVLVDREPDFRFAASFLRVMDGTRWPAAVSRPLERLARRGIEVVRGEVERVDPERRSAVAAGRTIEAEHLVIALGAEWAADTVPGLAEHGLTPSVPLRAPCASARRSRRSYAEPNPVVRLRRPGRLWLWGKVLFEQQVLRVWL